ncbi:hypothetical protein E3N88_29625 [Mikania micrantha]|uniref:Uncharacterized protein n=1 Tax=Mikania micrantha TaxID=192012 RepID=A0A5N6MK31_9ASTR|nr:hypothetical protein E3N88_29625 [Mikania micrantha]
MTSGKLVISQHILNKKEKTSPVAPKSRAMTTRYSKIAKKRKGVDTVDLEEPSELSVADLLNKIKDLEDQKKIVFAKAGHYEKEVAKVKKQMKEMKASYKLQFKEHIEGAKKSAAIAVLRPRSKWPIKLIPKALNRGPRISEKGVEYWLASMEVTKDGDAGETSKAGEGEVTGAGVGAGEQEVMMGDDDNGAKFLRKVPRNTTMATKSLLPATLPLLKLSTISRTTTGVDSWNKDMDVPPIDIPAWQISNIQHFKIHLMEEEHIRKP